MRLHDEMGDFGRIAFERKFGGPIPDWRAPAKTRSLSSILVARAGISRSSWILFFLSSSKLDSGSGSGLSFFFSVSLSLALFVSVRVQSCLLHSLCLFQLVYKPPISPPGSVLD